MPTYFYIIVFLTLVLLILGVILFPSIRLQIDYAKCESIIKNSSKSFYQAFSAIQDKQKRQGIYAVYAFCRLVDDAVDIQKSSSILTSIENQLIQFTTKNIAESFVFRALKNTASKFYPSSFDYKPFFDMIEGQKLDLNPSTYKSVEELIHYCDLVASSVGHMLLPILAPDSYSQLGEFANSLGRAMQITNILRDVGEDFLMGRTYLPAELMKKHSFALKEKITSNNMKAFVLVFEELAQIAQQNYQLCESKINLFPLNTRLPLHASLKLYQSILGACRQNDYNVFDKRNFVSVSERNQIVDDLKKIHGV